MASNVTRLPANSTDDVRSLALIKRTVAADCNDAEFELFIHSARHLGLDPLRRQIYALVYNKNDAAKRKMSTITAIDGFRVIAERTGDYRPDEEEPTITYDEARKSETNPLGIEKATVRVWKFSHGSWHKVTASAYWDEFAPLKDEWGFDDESGRRKPTGKKTLEGNWPKMGRVMISKCAEAQALRKAWPDAFSGVYVAEEMDRARVLDMSAAEAAEEGLRMERMERIGIGKSVLMVFGEAGNLEPVPYGKIADRCFEFIEQHKDEPSQILMWRDRNKAALQEFWAQNPSEALEVKKAVERATS
jgi:phage recombination protein Bet